MGGFGWQPSEFWAASPWDFWRALEGWKKRNGIGEDAKRGKGIRWKKGEVQALKDKLNTERRRNGNT